MNRNYFFLIGLSVLLACQNNENQNFNSENSDNQIDTVSVDSTIEETIIDADLSSFENKVYTVLFRSSKDQEGKYIEPACLSTPPTIRFEQLDNHRIDFVCGQDAMDHKFKSAFSDNDITTFIFDDGLTLKIEKLEYTELNPFERIEITLSDFEQLYMGYYADSLTSFNSEKAVLVLYNEENTKILKEQGRYTAIPCPEDIFD
ncbi:MAG: hypothetical protein R2780_10280 [Crocinitomicaceae bacterium]|nr:hypothetical protein [Crocinitomicaceae bacterium]